MATIAREILEQFAWICQTPHPPGKEAALRGRIIDRLRGLGLNPWTDARGNLACDLPASPGCIQGPLTAVQAHLDMVCAAGSAAYVPERDPIKPIERDGFLCTAGESSLGADCGAGAAVILWLAEHPDLPHPPLRLLFTVEEEIGLRGAQEMDPTCVAGVRYLINTDGFRWGRIVTGSAGGVREHYTHTLDWAAPLSGARAWKVQVSGLRGGHSGFDIGAGRANALLVLGQVIRQACAQKPAYLAAFAGGTAFNAIPYEASAILVARDAGTAARLEQVGAQILDACRGTDPDGRLTVTETPLPQAVWTNAMTAGLLDTLQAFADGVFARHSSGAVADSSNLGHIYAQDGKLYLDAMVRCMDAAAERTLLDSHRAVCEAHGFSGQIVSRYPAWPSREDGRLGRLAAQSFRQVTGRAPEITVQHVGLEPSELLRKNPDMECICVGMDLRDCHSPKERWRLDTIGPFANMLCSILEGLAR